MTLDAVVMGVRGVDMEKLANDIGIGLVMNRACNLHCKYCMQRKLGMKMADYEKPDKRVDDVIRFIQEIADARTTDIPLFISFYGGEPLMSAAEIRQILSSLSHKEKFHFEITTNGKLLTRDIVNLLNDNDVHVMISWDGKDSSAQRGFDVIKEKRELIMQLKHLCFSSVVCGGSSVFDRVKEISAIEEEYYGRCGRHTDKNAIYPVKGESEEKSYRDKDFRSDLQKIFTKIGSGKMSHVEWEYASHFVKAAKDFSEGRKWQPSPTSCAMGTMIAVAMDGTVNGCINANDNIATIDMSLEEIVEKVKTLNRTALFEKCTDCAYAVLRGTTPACRLDAKLNPAEVCRHCKVQGDILLEEIAKHFGGKADGKSI